MTLRGATVMVTGGAQRLGRAIAMAFAKEGSNLIVNYNRSVQAARSIRREAEALGIKVTLAQADVSDARQFDLMLQQLPSRVDVLIANAGLFYRTPLRDVTESDWETLLRANFYTALIPATRLGQRMMEQKHGCIIILADVAGVRPWRDYAPYCIAKSCAVALTKHLAIELAPHVRVNAIAPGPILFPPDFDETARRREVQRTLLKRQGDPRDICEAALFLARHDYVTGAVLPVDGGRLLVRS
jgi:pteridine reductase